MQVTVKITPIEQTISLQDIQKHINTWFKASGSPVYFYYDKGDYQLIILRHNDRLDHTYAMSVYDSISDNPFDLGISIVNANSSIAITCPIIKD